MPAELVERTAERAVLDQAFSDAAAGQARVVVVSGEPGIGKSALLADATRGAAARGFHVVSAAALEVERDTPFRPLTEALAVAADAPAPAARRAADLLYGAVAAGDPSYRTLQVSEALLRLMSDLADQRPLVLCVDDLQWADDASLSTIGRAALRLAFHGVVLLLAHRDDTPVPRLAAFRDSLPAASAAFVDLRPLSDDGLRAMAAKVLGRPPTEPEELALAKTGGNPLFAGEVLEGLRAGVEGAPTESLRGTVLRRVARLPEPARDLAHAVAVLGADAVPAAVAGVAGGRAAARAAAVRDAVAGGLLGEEDGRLAFRHALVAEIVYDDLPATARAALHGAAADALARCGVAAATVVRHRLRAAGTGDPDTPRWLLRAAEDALPLAPRTALAYADLALREVAVAEPELEALSVLRAEALLWSGQTDAAEEAARDLSLRLRRVELRTRARLVRLRALLVAGRATDFVRFTEAELAHLPDAERAWALAESAYCLVEARQTTERASTASGLDDPAYHQRVETLAAEALALAQRVGDSTARCVALCARSSALDSVGRFADAIEVSREAVAVAEATPGAGAIRVAPHFHLALQLLLADRVREAEGAVLAGMRHAESFGSPLVAPLFHHLLGRIAFGTGRWDDAWADWETALALADELSAPFVVADAAPSFLAQIAACRGDLREAERQVAAAEAAAARAGAGGSPFATWARTLLLEATARRGAAAEVAAVLHRGATDAGWLALYRIAGVDLARVLAAGGDIETAGEVASAVEELARRAGAETVCAAAMLARAHANGDADLAVAAEAKYDRSPLVFDAARAAHAAGVLLAAAGRRDEAAPALARARAAYDAVGATRLVDEVDRAAADADLVSRRPRRRRPATGWDALTATEHRVAELVAEGLTNAAVAERLVISERTVHTHVSHIFAKLGLTSRAQLAARAADRR